MRRPAARLWMRAAAVFPLAAGAGGAVPHAHRETLLRLARETDVVTRPPRPGVMEYLAHLTGRIFKILFGWLKLPKGDLSPVLDLLGLAARILAWAIIAAAVILILRTILRWTGSRPRRGTAPESEKVTVCARRAVTAEGQRAKFLEALEAGDLGGALEALWLWTGLRLAGDHLDRSWTSSELLETTARPDLFPALRRLDTWRYGPRRPSPEAVRRLAGELEEATA